MLQIKRFHRDNKEYGGSYFFGLIHEPLEMLDQRVNDFCSKNKVISITHHKATDRTNQFYVIVYEAEK